VHILKKLAVKCFVTVVDKGLAGQYSQKRERLRSADIKELGTCSNPDNQRYVNGREWEKENAELYAKQYTTQVK
jgi:hypothetical protein